MIFTDAELEYLASQPLGRLATAQPDGTLQASPVGYTYNAELGTIDIGGLGMARSRKYRNLATNGTVAFVVDDLRSRDPWRVRCLEVRGTAEATPPTRDGADGFDGALIRIHPRQVISFGIEEDLPPHEMRPSNRRVGAAAT